MNMQVFEMLKSLQGKKLEMSYYDKESDQWVLIFEGKQAFLVEEINQIGDFNEFTNKTLVNELPYAETMLALKNLATQPAATSPTTDGQQSTEGASSEQAGSDQV